MQDKPRATFSDNESPGVFEQAINQVLAKSGGVPMGWPEQNENTHTTIEQRMFLRRKFKRILDGVHNARITIDYRRQNSRATFSVFRDSSIGWRIEEHGVVSMLNEERDAIAYLINRLFKEVVSQLKSKALIKIELWGDSYYTLSCKTGTSSTITAERYKKYLKHMEKSK